MKRNVDEELEQAIYQMLTDDARFNVYDRTRELLNALTDSVEEHVLTFDIVIGEDGDYVIDCINIIQEEQVEDILEGEFEDPNDPMLVWPDAIPRIGPTHFGEKTFTRNEMMSSKYLRPMLDYDFPIKHTYNKDSDLYQKMIMMCKMILI